MHILILLWKVCDLIMKNVKKLLALLLLFSLLTAFTSCNTGPGVTPVFSENKQLHIGAWVAPPPAYINDNTYKTIAESGINTIYGLYDVNAPDYLKALKCAQDAGINYFVRDTSLGSIHEGDFNLLPDLISSYKNSKAFTGNLVADEPGPSLFDQLGALHAEYKKLLPNKDFYVNLFPTYSSLAQRGGLDYNQYLNQFIQKVKPDVLSFDFYPLMQRTDGTSIKEDYLYNLGLVSDATKKAKIPFWSFIQAMAFSAAGMQNRAPNENDIRWQVYTNLAFGATGIQYFCYWTPGNDANLGPDNAMIDTKGNKTPIYTYVQTVNKEVIAFQNAYLNFHNVGVMVYPSVDASPELYMENPLKSWAPIKSVTSEHPVVVGCFEDNNGNKALVLVNYSDPGKKLSNKVTINLNGVKGLTVYKKGKPIVTTLNGGSYEVNLEYGEGQFILFNK
jgi:hypothetical protein